MASFDWSHGTKSSTSVEVVALQNQVLRAYNQDLAIDRAKILHGVIQIDGYDYVGHLMLPVSPKDELTRAKGCAGKRNLL